MVACNCNCNLHDTEEGAGAYAGEGCSSKRNHPSSRSGRPAGNGDAVARCAISSSWVVVAPCAAARG
ncbi:hypothetical protein E2562_020149 [Oryza meyeriana var. granulata]|uniref:Uncharacterized protein n=1 Tax=Oryza meyeriana var. granulata TaxID=110450 RepID=A0A6G1BMG4_9ORYZ|nr:hypothetical protein E2562_020149 [Oryza meyeriana var. granulata]